MKRYYQTYLKSTARTLRKNMTGSEIKLWRLLRKRQISNLQFYRQKPLGRYIVDFFCPAKNLIIEIDGGQHYEPKNIPEDKAREKYLKEILKLKVIRFTNLDILRNIEGVFEKIMRETQ